MQSRSDCQVHHFDSMLQLMSGLGCVRMLYCLREDLLNMRMSYKPHPRPTAVMQLDDMILQT